MKIRIAGGLVVDPSQKLEAIRDVIIEGDKIALIEKPAPVKSPKPGQTDEHVVDARNKWVFPGIIDMHVHLREPGREVEETIATGTWAAVRGGVTTVLAMPNTHPVIDTAAMVHFVRDRARTAGNANVLVAGAVTKGQKGEELAEMGHMIAAGAVAFTDDGQPVMNAQIMRRALEYAKQFGAPILDHCEDKHLSAGGVMHEGRSSVAKGLMGIPAASEVVMAMRDLALAELTESRIHLCHVSCGETVELVRAAKRRGVKVTAETAPHYFSLSDADIPGYDADFKMNPPLRSEADVERILAGLADGTLDAIATDHAPHSPSKKAQGFAAAPFGIIGLQTLLPLALRLVHRKVVTLKQLVSLLSENPAAILGLKYKGSLRPGMDADVTIVDPKAEVVVQAQGESKSQNTPFKGWKLLGKASAVVINGRLVVDDGRIV